MPDTGEPALDALIRQLRLALGYSQDRLAERLRDLSGAAITREYVSRWERGCRTPSRYWLPHLAAALQVPLSTLEAERVRRRAFLQLAAVAPVLGVPDTAADLMASIASGDSGPLAEVQTTHRADLALAQLADTDRASLLRLGRWMSDGASDVLRVNAAGILAKTTNPDMLDEVALALSRDGQARHRYMLALAARVGDSVPALAGEVLNQRDAGARWCAAWLLGKDGSPAARSALTAALHREPVRENVRAIGLILSGVDPCDHPHGPLTIMADRTGARMMLPQYFGVLLGHRCGGHGRALWRVAERWGAGCHADYQLLQAFVGGASERLFLSEGLRSLGFIVRVAA